MKFDNSQIRRQDRLLDQERAFQLLAQGEYGILSMLSDNQQPYGLPLSFAFETDHIYFHCAPQGRKLQAISQNEKVSFCIVGRTHVVADKFTTAYESVIAQGNIRQITDEKEMMHALELILDKYSPSDKTVGMMYAQKSFHRTAILRMDIDTVSAKSKKI